MKLSEFAGQSPYSPVRAPKAEHPKGWEPGVAWNGTHGTITSNPVETPDPRWETWLKAWGFDPELFEIVEPVQIRTWDAAVGNGETKQFWYHKANIRTRGLTGRVDVDYAALCREVQRSRPHKPVAATNARSLVVCLADWQVGKAGEVRGGSEEFVVRAVAMIDTVRERIKRAKPETLYVLGLGDIIENCDGHYDRQTFSVDLDRRGQINLARRVIVKALTTWSKLAPRVVVAAVGGNHGENRKDGRSFTSPADNDDVAVFEQVADAFKLNEEAYGHVIFVIPGGELAVTLDIHGHIVALAHGHQMRVTGKLVQEKARNWWKGQTWGRQPVGDASILVTAHYHHFSCIESAGRTHIQCPTLDGGSNWHTDTTGESDRAGTLLFAIDEAGWHDMEIV